MRSERDEGPERNIASHTRDFLTVYMFSYPADAVVRVYSEVVVFMPRLSSFICVMIKLG